jgi:hypothetical protein
MQLSGNEKGDIKVTDRESWRWDSYSKYFSDYCQLAQKFTNGTDYSEKALIAEVGRDWHPLGFAQDLENSTKDPAPCEVNNWDDKFKGLGTTFGARIFLIENLELAKIKGRILIDFKDPHFQLMPDIHAQ